MSAKTSKTIHCAAVDLGATSGCVIVGTWAKHRLTLTELHRFPNQFRSAGGHDYWDIPGLWVEITTGLRAAKKRFPKLASVGVDTWGVDYVLVNDAGRTVFPTHAYRDARTQPGLQLLAHTRAALERIYAATGIANVFYNSSLQLEETVASCPAVADLAPRCLFLPDYFNYLLSGRMENEVSLASTTQLLDVHGRDWSRATLDHFHIPATWFTTPILANTVLGPVTGLPGLKGVKVVAVPGHDTACAYDAMPANLAGGDLYISSGTWSLVGFESDTPVLGREALAARVSNERIGDGRYRPLTNVNGLWLMEQTLKDFTARLRSDAEWGRLITAAGKLPAPAALIDMTFAEFANPPSMKVAIDAQLKRRKLPRPKNLAAYVRLICDSLGRGHADAVRNFERLAGRPQVPAHPHRGRRFQEPPALSGDGRCQRAARPRVHPRGHRRWQHRLAARRSPRGPQPRDIPPVFRAAIESQNLHPAFLIKSRSAVAYRLARQTYAAYGVDTEAAIRKALSIPVSLHCWQADDVRGLETPKDGLAGGGIMSTGGYPGRARNGDEMRADLDLVLKLLPGKQRLNLHAFYAETGKKVVDRDAIEPEHFARWLSWAKSRRVGLDFNPTYFAHQKANSGFTLSSPDKAIRRFWINHGKACRHIAQHFAKELGKPCMHNHWIPDGAKDAPADRWAPRERLVESYDAIFADKSVNRKLCIDAVEGKLFGLGSEDYVVGSQEFYSSYAQSRDLVLCLDLGHYHPTESVADKVSALMQFHKRVLLHTSRPIRWDSDHVVILAAAVRNLFLEIARGDAWDRVFVALDFFDASINRIAAYVIGARATRQAILCGLLDPSAKIKEADAAGRGHERLALMEQTRALPWGAVWDELCERDGVAPAALWLKDVARYEKTVLAKRA